MKSYNQKIKIYWINGKDLEKITINELFRRLKNERPDIHSK